jgi:hypothetical protein
MNNPHFRAGLVWLASALFLLVYAGLGLSGISVPGVEQLVDFMSATSGSYIYIAAFMAVLFEGTYLLGSFIPGTTLLTVIAIISQAGGPFIFLGTILSIMVGWCVAGFVNIFIIANLVRGGHIAEINENRVRDNILMTWYPAFRANYEVAQVVAGLPKFAVFRSAIKVRLIVSTLAAIVTLIIPLFVDIREIDNSEGFLSVLVVSTVCFAVAIAHFSPRVLSLVNKYKHQGRELVLAFIRKISK